MELVTYSLRSLCLPEKDRKNWNWWAIVLHKRSSSVCEGDWKVSPVHSCPHPFWLHHDCPWRLQSGQRRREWQVPFTVTQQVILGLISVCIHGRHGLLALACTIYWFVIRCRTLCIRNCWHDDVNDVRCSWHWNYVCVYQDSVVARFPSVQLGRHPESGAPSGSTWSSRNWLHGRMDICTVYHLPLIVVSTPFTLQ